MRNRTKKVIMAFSLLAFVAVVASNIPELRRYLHYRYGH